LDAAGNRSQQVVANYDGIGTGAGSTLTSTHTTAYTYNSNDWLTVAASQYVTGSGTTNHTTAYTYNANGSQTAATGNVGEADEKTTPYFYDFEDKLVGIGAEGDPTTHAYSYDAEGNRIAQSVTRFCSTLCSAIAVLRCD
jgi:YD repeat-containing protein